ncbi:MAG: rod shape-determining protein MreD [Solirubrobacterales bacterium]
MTPETGTSILRAGALVVCVVIIQLAVVTQFRLFGVVPDMVPVLVVMIGLLGGGTAGAMSGFVAGFLVDLMLIQTMGVSSLLLTAGGYAAGRLRELRDPIHPLVNPAVGAIAAVYFTVGFAAMQFSLGQPAPEAWSMTWQTFWSGAFGALWATPMYRVARWALMPSLGRDDPVFRRRRASLVPTRVLEPPSIDPRGRRRRMSARVRRGGR